jgi:hypothetical protein
MVSRDAEKAGRGLNHRDTEAQRREEERKGKGKNGGNPPLLTLFILCLLPSLCLCASVVQILFPLEASASRLTGR